MTQPLVAPGAPLSAARVNRHSRQLMLPGYGEDAQRRLAAARVLVIGAGGLGSAVVPALAGSGIGTIGIADDDDVELSNLPRQLSHGVADLGRPKVDSLADTVAAIDPECRVVRHRVRLTAANLPGILADYDLVVDGSDNFPTRYLANDAAHLAGVPLVWGAILRFQGQLGVAWRGHGPGYRDLFPTPPAPGDVPSCELGGVLPTLCLTIGAMLASEVVKLVTGIGEPLLGRVLSYDALSGRSREIAYGADPDAAEITGLVDYERFCGLPPREASADAAAAAISAAELLRRLRAGEALRLLDVREPGEAELRRIAGSELVPLGELLGGAEPAAAPGPLVVYCELGMRSARAAAALTARGHADVVSLDGGLDRFAALGAEYLSRRPTQTR
ncbi:ThiF family adenylyltransferase [Agromyces sp. NBRC 114283]|uniref:ThiF family adenylyltransferase n=1 Tax=Agromyces sp. NBRC 114283 TaxID=2994521 RepID=UPI0024A4FAED|nr:ThiF family adenylyltransferase [Agromyces sp. NBRC 114283]GLU90854.1 adenylyltransferase/sulfurtransferase MoeZ [Agromyces sp. NBRC 114283]